MKRFLLFVFAAFVGFVVHAKTETIQWYVDGNVYTTTTCTYGEKITLPPAPTRSGYIFSGWRLRTNDN